MGQSDLLNGIQDTFSKMTRHQYCASLSNTAQNDVSLSKAGSESPGSPGIMLSTGNKPRRSTPIRLNKRTKNSHEPGCNLSSDQDGRDETDLDPTRTISPCSSPSTYHENASILSASLASKDDVLGLNTVFPGSRGSSLANDLGRSRSPNLLTLPGSDYDTRPHSTSEASPIMPIKNDLDRLVFHVYDLVDTTIDVSLDSQRERSPTTSPDPIVDYGQSNNKFPPEFWFPSSLNAPSVIALPKLPDYGFVPPAQISDMPKESLSAKEIFMKLLSDEPETSSNNNPALRPRNGSAFKSRLSFADKNLLNIKLRPITSTKSRALHSKEIPPLYIPILPPVLAWCLVADADQEPDDWLEPDEIALRAARHVTGPRVLKRNVTGFQKQQLENGRTLQNDTGDDLLQEYLSVVTKKKSVKKVSFDDSAARIVLADWKGISVEEL